MKAITKIWDNNNFVKNLGSGPNGDLLNIWKNNSTFGVLSNWFQVWSQETEHTVRLAISYHHFRFLIG